MKKSYQIIEPPELNALVGAPACHDTAIAVLAWLIESLRVELKGQLDGARLELIRVEYHGAYPAIGIHYEEGLAEDFAPLVEATVARILRNASSLEFVSFVAKSGVDWRKLTDQLLRTPT